MDLDELFVPRWRPRTARKYMSLSTYRYPYRLLDRRSGLAWAWKPGWTSLPTAPSGRAFLAGTEERRQDCESERQTTQRPCSVFWLPQLEPEDRKVNLDLLPDANLENTISQE